MKNKVIIYVTISLVLLNNIKKCYFNNDTSSIKINKKNNESSIKAKHFIITRVSTQTDNIKTNEISTQTDDTQDSESFLFVNE